VVLALILQVIMPCAEIEPVWFTRLHCNIIIDISQGMSPWLPVMKMVRTRLHINRVLVNGTKGKDKKHTCTVVGFLGWIRSRLVLEVVLPALVCINTRGARPYIFTSLATVTRWALSRVSKLFIIVGLLRVLLPYSRKYWRLTVWRSEYQPSN